MQTAVMAPLPSPSFPPGSTFQPPPPDHHQPHSGPSSSPSNPTHSIRPPPQQPAYPTLSYPQQNGWMYPPAYYPPQSRYSQQPFYPPAYGQTGGPGPATMQNGYGGPQPDGFPSYLRHSSYGPPPGYHPTNDSQSSFDCEPLKSGILLEKQPYPHRPQPPPFHDAYHGNSPYPPIPNGPTQPSGPQSPYQTFYPPDHPYAHGGGFGYPQYPPGPGLSYGNGYGSYPSGPPPPEMLPVQTSPIGKGLNPAAQGFKFTPPGPPAVNGDLDRPPAKPDEIPVFASIHSQHSASSVPNGIPGPVQQWVAPVMVNGEKLKGIGGRRPSGESEDGGSLGLTQMETSSPPPQFLEPAATPVRVPTAMTQSTSTSAMSTSSTTPITPVLVQTPRVTTDGESSILLFPQSASTSQPQADGRWNFVGPSMSGFISPPPSATLPSFAQAMSSQAATKSAPRRRIAASTDALPLKLRSSRPKACSTAENVYNSSLSGAIPKTVQTEQIAVSGDAPKPSARRKGKPSGKRIVFAAGVDEEAMMRMGVKTWEGKGLTFGSVTTSPWRSMTPPSEAAPIPVSGAITPVLQPPLKPTSWAALLGGSSKPFSRSSSLPSSMHVSPSKSIVSLATESEVGASRQSTEPTTPRSTAPTLPMSTGAFIATATAPRPVFNYAAAAATGAKISPQDELAKLLSDGLGGRSRGTPLCLPRGLINTGNMCFANTVGCASSVRSRLRRKQILQVLVYCPPFTELFEELSKRLKADLSRRTPLLESM